MAYCTNCGKEIADGEIMCPHCGQPVGKILNLKLDLHPLLAVSCTLSVLAFLFGFILTTTYFVTRRGIAYNEYLSVIPALVSMSIGIYHMASHKDDKRNSFVALLSVGLNAFTLLYVFVGFMVAAAG